MSGVIHAIFGRDVASHGQGTNALISSAIIGLLRKSSGILNGQAHLLQDNIGCGSSFFGDAHERVYRFKQPS
jgi:hypothetical protein